MIIPDKVLAGNIALYYDALPDPLHVIQVLEEAAKHDARFKWDRAVIHHGEVSNYRSNDAVGLSQVRTLPEGQLPELAAEDRRIFEAIEPRLSSYAATHDVKIAGDEGWQVLRYGPGKEYKAHQDYHKDNQRIVSAVLYLNDDFIGGETEFIRFGVAVEPRAGMLALFPSNYAYTHVARPLLKGTKYAIVSWFHE